MLLKSWLDDGCLCSSFKEIFLYTSSKSINPLVPSHWNVPNYLLIQHLWNHLGYLSYDQRYPRKVQLLFLEHFYFCFVVLLIMIVSIVSSRNKRSTWRWTTRFEDSEGQGKQPFDHVRETFLCMSYSTILLLQRNHDDVEPLWWFASVTSSLTLALCMTLPPYEGYAGGSR